MSGMGGSRKAAQKTRKSNIKNIGRLPIAQNKGMKTKMLSDNVPSDLL
jgi:hypothetical protein